MEEKESEQPQVDAQSLTYRVKQLFSKPTPRVVGIVIIVLLLIAGITVVSRSSQERNTNTQGFDTHQDNRIQTQNSNQEWPLLWGPVNTSCQKKDSIKFSFLPIDSKDIKFIQPIGELREGHIVPGDHAGIDYETSPTSTPVKVFAPADGVLVNVERHAYTPPAGYPQNIRHYHFYLAHSCTLFTGFVHLTEFAPEILAASPELKKLNDENIDEYKNMPLNIPVKAGQQIGTAWSFGLLGVVTVDLQVTNKGYLNPQSYKAENWRIHSVSFFDYLNKPLQSQVFAKNPKVAEPRGGKIDFDIDGKLVGNWFEQGKGGFRDESKEPKQCGNFPCPYWDGHLAFVYDYVDPLQLRVSIGHDWGLSGRTPFGVKGNAPDFKDIGAFDGLVKYELVGLKDVTREKGYDSQTSLITVNDESRVLGTVLVQMLDNQKITMEIFPGKVKEQINAFTPKAKVYER